MAAPVVTANNITLSGQGVGAIAQAFRLNGAKGVKVYIDITAISGGATLTVAIADARPDGPGGNAPAAKLTSTALAATGVTELDIYPGLPATANVSANGVCTNDIVLTMTVGTATLTGAIIYVVPLF